MSLKERERKRILKKGMNDDIAVSLCWWRGGVVNKTNDAV